MIDALLDEEYSSLADIARASGRSYQTIHRWHRGKVGAISQDDMADMLVDLDREPTEFGVRPSKGWMDRHAGRKLAEGLDLSVVLEAIEGVHIRVADVPLLQARVEMVAADVRAIREHLGIQQPQPTGA